MDHEKRSIFRSKITQMLADNRVIVYLDESGFMRDMPRISGYSAKGDRCYGSYDYSTKDRTNVIGALVGSILLTVVLLSCYVDTQVFTCWVKQDLMPKLPARSIIVMDNASFHKGKEMQEAIEKAGHTLLYLPAYSPDLNPIEKKWAQIKHLRRTLRCSVDELFQYHVT